MAHVHPLYIPQPYQDSAEAGRLILRDGSTAFMDQRAHLNRKLRFCITPYLIVAYVVVHASVSRTGKTTHGASSDTERT
jgi:hypothetical protein